MTDYRSLLSFALTTAHIHGATLQDAEDIAQEAVVALWLAEDKIEYPKGWLVVYIRRALWRMWERENEEELSGREEVNPWEEVEERILLWEIVERWRSPWGHVTGIREWIGI